MGCVPQKGPQKAKDEGARPTSKNKDKKKENCDESHELISPPKF